MKRTSGNTLLCRRDQLLIQTLAIKLRLMSLQQIANTFFGGQIANASRRLKTLEHGRYMLRHRTVVRHLPAPKEPLVAWTPGQDTPQFTKTVYMLGRRWIGRPTRLTSLYLVGPRASAALGLKPHQRLPHVLQASHDLGLAATYLHFLENRPELAMHWVGENSMNTNPREGQVPDAIIANTDQTLSMAIEFGGQYTAKRLHRFHNHCKKRRLTYELW